jgi:hypothetical protein
VTTVPIVTYAVAILETSLFGSIYHGGVALSI